MNPAGQQLAYVVGAPLKIDCALSLSGPLDANGQSARLANQIWEEDDL